MRDLIRKPRSLRHPLGEPLLCATPWCQYLARGRYTRLIDGIRWPFCSSIHADNFEFREGRVR